MRILLLLLGVGTLSAAFASEGLVLRRISEFWKDEAFDQAKAQIDLFLRTYPSSDYCDNVYAMLGDLYLKEKAYEEALSSYEKITKQEVKAKIEANYLQTLHKTGNLRALIQCADRESGDPRVQFLLAEACFHLGQECSSPEDQRALYTQAATHYNALSSSEYAGDALWPLAEIYKALGELPKAVSYYFALAENYPDQTETLLFQAAYLQSKFDKKAAVHSFLKVHQMQGKNAQGAAYNALLLQFDAGEYREFLSTYKRIAETLSEEKRASLRFYLAKSLYECERPEEASALLDGQSDKSSSLLLAACAEKLGDADLLRKALQTLSTSYPSDSDTAKAHLLFANMSIEAGDLLRAQESVSYVLRHFPEHPEREALSAEYAALLAQSALWRESREAFQSLLQEYPETSFKEEAWRNILHATLKEGDRELFADLLLEALEKEEIFTGEEREQNHLLLIKLLIEQGRAQGVAEQLARFLDNYPHSAEGYRLAALFFEGDAPSFVFHAERALALDPLVTQAGELHLKLYNLYIQEEGAEEKAADHLFRSAAQGEISLKKENLLWLASYYYDKKSDSEAYERALFLYDKASQEAPTPSEEREFLKYAELLRESGRGQDALSLLERLCLEQEAHAELGWRFQRQVLFELAQAYAHAGSAKKALDTYAQLIGTSTHLPSYFSRAALLERAKLQYALLGEEERCEENQDLQQVLQSLKDLQLHKKLYSEPLHLEAALEYVSVMSALVEEERRDARTLFLLQRMKEAFTLHSDITSRDYHSQKTTLPDQAAILENYLCYIDAEIMRLEGRTDRAEKRLLKLQESPLHPALLKRVRTSMDALYDPT